MSKIVGAFKSIFGGAVKAVTFPFRLLFTVVKVIGIFILLLITFKLVSSMLRRRRDRKFKEEMQQTVMMSAVASNPQAAMMSGQLNNFR